MIVVWRLFAVFRTLPSRRTVCARADWRFQSIHLNCTGYEMRTIVDTLLIRIVHIFLAFRAPQIAAKRIRQRLLLCDCPMTPSGSQRCLSL